MNLWHMRRNSQQRCDFLPTAESTQQHQSIDLGYGHQRLQEAQLLVVLPLQYLVPALLCDDWGRVSVGNVETILTATRTRPTVRSSPVAFCFSVTAPITLKEKNFSAKVSVWRKRRLTHRPRQSEDVSKV